MLGRYAEAAGELERALRLRPDLAEGHGNLGSTYLALGKREAALKQYQQLKLLDPDLASALLRLIYRDRIVDARR